MQTGLIYRLDKVTYGDGTNKESNKEEETEEEEEQQTVQSCYVKMQWKGCNPHAQILTSGKSSGYYTFGETGYENIKAKGFDKIVYKDLYPGIDVEYTLNDEATELTRTGGIKYKLIVHPGADVSAVKMHYSGDVEAVSKDNFENIVIETPAGDITDHAPISFTEGTQASVKSFFELHNNVVSFLLDIPSASSLTSQTIIIDPWTTVPTSLQTNHSAYDIAVDDHSNVYVSGGTITATSFTAKYNSGGTLLWTFTTPANWNPNGYEYSKFGIIPHSGTVYIGEGFNYSGPRVMKISTDGLLQNVSPHLNTNNEIWRMYYNTCTGQLIGFGGGTEYNNGTNLRILADTNLTSGISSDFTTCHQSLNDITSAAMDNNGDFYALMVSSSCSPYNNHLMKSLISSNYASPPAFDVLTFHKFREAVNIGIPGFYGSGITGGPTVRSNALVVSDNYLYSYDGRTLKVWNKNNGNLRDSIVVDPTYLKGYQRNHEGIAIAKCKETIYLGGTNMVHVYGYNGTTFTLKPSITLNIPDNVYDLKPDPYSGILYVCGKGFVSAVPIEPCPANQLATLTTINIDPCQGSASVTTTDGTPPYSYFWSNGTQTSTISGVMSGTYSVTVFDNSCPQRSGSDTVVITAPHYMNVSNDTTLCAGSSVTLSAHGANSYTWTPLTGLTLINDSVVTATPSATTVYTVIGNYTDGCTFSRIIHVNVENPPVINISNDTSICLGNSIMLHAYGGISYNWSPANTLNYSTVPNPIAITNTTTKYYVAVTTAHCPLAIDSVTVTIMPVPTITTTGYTTICLGDSVVLSASGADFYTWSPPNGLSSTTGSVVTASPNDTTNYIVTGTTINGCTSSAYVQVFVASLSAVHITNDTSICENNVILLQASGGLHYLWSPAATLNNANIANPLASPVATTTYTVTISTGPCSDTASVTITVLPGPTAHAWNDTTICSGSTDTIHASGGVSYLWNNNAVTPDIIVSPAVSTTYTVTVSSANGCTASDHVIINTYHPTPFLNCDSNIIACTNAFSGYQWFFNNNSITGAHNPVCPYVGPGYYFVQVTDSLGCSGISANCYFYFIGIESILQDEINFYPNPSSGSIAIEAPLSSSIGIYNIHGQIIKIILPDKNKTIIDISDMASGMYFLKVITDKGIAIKKFIKE